MKNAHAHCRLLPGLVVALTGALAISGCNNKPAHPDDKSAVTSSLDSNNLGAVSVSQDQAKGVITLTGNVDTQGDKDRAENLAKQAAPGYTVADEIGVRPPQASSEASSVSSSLDSGIEDNFKAILKGHRALNDQSIDYKAKNGTLVLTGSVKTERQKREAGELAKHVPNVQQVVNELEVKSGKHSTASS